MAHTTNRIYIDTSVTPHIGVSIADIQSVIGSSRNDIGGLIVNGNINKWAKYKPEHHPNQKRPLSNSDRAANNFGLTTPALQRNLETIAANYASYYQYTPPASANDWYRFSDWVKWDNGWVHGIGYLRSARCFYESDNFTTNSYSGTPHYYVNYNHDTGVSLTVVWASNMTDEEISRADLNLGLSSISNAYLGVIVKIGTSYRGGYIRDHCHVRPPVAPDSPIHLSGRKCRQHACILERNIDDIVKSIWKQSDGLFCVRSVLVGRH